MIPKPSLPAKMAVVLRNYGCATLIMTAVMILTSQHTCVDSAIVQLAGNGVQGNRITVVYRNGCSVMEKTIAATTAMNCRKIAQFATVRQTSSAPTTAVYRSMFDK